MSNKKLKSIMTPKKTLINLKVTAKELKELQNIALKFAGGNLSAWLRYAGVNYKPTKKELSDVK